MPRNALAGSSLDRRLMLIWGAGVLAYIVSIVNRTSLSAVGTEASARFHADASTLALFAVLQLLVYGAMQIPVGLLLDRFGSRRVMTVGMLVMAAGQLVMALTPDVHIAIAARVLLGAGDAAIFPSILRVIAAWFPVKRAPIIIQFTGLLGQFGQIVSVIPLAALLHATNWPTAFVSLAAVGALAGILTFAMVRNEPEETGAITVVTSRPDLRQGFVDAWKHPGTRLAFWSHFSTPFAGNAFALLWGYPFLVEGLGLSVQLASLIFTFYVLVGLVLGPVVGAASARHPLRRSWIVLTVVGAQAALWAVVILWPGAAPLPVIFALVAALCAGGPGSMIAFDLTRAHNPAQRLGTATGIVNGGGFLASVLAILFIGIAMDVQGAGTPATYSLAAFKIAFLVQFPIWAVGIVALLRERRRTRAVMAARGIHLPRIRDVIARRR
ncbi:MFS transporter [Agreia pratensis]|uniref:Sugar phosphate permease n=1 Tax=Agreia pratensis TaxID=150121 RepID=A0A1X7ISF3_9MICO|nr:MFS transporter [Agreia pratensis]SMG17832.1 Sugar phosphate permease [Agreia pratensis]